MASRYPELFNNDDKDYIFQHFEQELKSLISRFDRLYKTSYFTDSIDITKFRNPPTNQLIGSTKTKGIAMPPKVVNEASPVSFVLPEKYKYDSDQEEEDNSEDEGISGGLVGSNEKLSSLRSQTVMNKSPFAPESRISTKERKREAPIHIEAEINGKKVARSYTSEGHKQFGLFKSTQYAEYLKQAKEAGIQPSWTTFMKISGEKWKKLTTEERAQPNLNIRWV